MIPTDLTEFFIRFFDILLAVLVGFYTLFAFVILRQVQLMHTTFTTLWGNLFVFLAALHLFISLGLLLISINTVFF